jgi:hypothetical protein
MTLGDERVARTRTPPILCAGHGGDAAESARYLEIPLGLVQAVVAYYGAYTAEIDQQIEANEQESAESHAAYLAGQAAVRR